MNWLNFSLRGRSKSANLHGFSRCRSLKTRNRSRVRVRRPPCGARNAVAARHRQAMPRDNRTQMMESAGKPGSVVDSHSSGPDVAVRLKRSTRERRGPRHCSPIRSCSRWGLPCHAALSPRAVRSYRTVSPLPDPLAGPSAVCSLLHFPSARAAQALPGTLPCGARTFLGALARDATVWPTPDTRIQKTEDR